MIYPTIAAIRSKTDSEAVSASACYLFLWLIRAVFTHRKYVEVPETYLAFEPA